MIVSMFLRCIMLKTGRNIVHTYRSSAQPRILGCKQHNCSYTIMDSSKAPHDLCEALHPEDCSNWVETLDYCVTGRETSEHCKEGSAMARKAFNYCRDRQGQCQM